jgi:hypothetical protein
MIQDITRGKGPMRATYRGHTLVHEAAGLPIIEKLVINYNFSLILELGCGWGGLTYLFHYNCPNAEIYAYDNGRNIQHRKSFSQNVKFSTADILGVNHDTPLQSLVELCKDPRRKLLYCDNGNKIAEVKMYAIHLNKGDILGLHDWGTEIWRHSIEDVLKDFDDHEVNKEFEKRNCRSRFFIKR